ncbi:MAG TPA: stage II sporulation protein D [Firmicutes bacterium]|jgi:stage II sporulation protein D|nr:stage II sporulation protein D [Bacillota bacterium]HAZ22778.1 stage II sporulation protein D [Bacillota bacterium]HBE05629.1 stage II sporulation protein D [Bacillota bacterium]HBG43990.1 stage II sporulation protein D [Bacillota bacterium]HBL67637.1 stage II sporulation protein D [Bacillota bacterium]
MKKAAAYLFSLIVILTLMLPAFLVRSCQAPQQQESSAISVKLYDTQAHALYRLTLEDYLVGVVAAEMPANFHLEALKAQAVAARTFTVKRLKCFGGKGSKYHPDADLSCDPGEGQAWLGEKELRTKWGMRYGTNLARIRQAVTETASLLLTYEGKPIEAIYHSTCGGVTEAAVEVWGKDYPYLRSVVCGADGHSPKYRQTYRFTIQEAAAKLKVKAFQGKAITASTQGSGILKMVGQSNTGRAQQIIFAGKKITAEQFRTALGLNSPRIRYNVSGKNLVITTIGYGHGVGLCQYGCDGWAQKGYSFSRILQHYYPGTTLVKIANQIP